MEESRRGIIGVITSPLGFFALSLLIVEGFITIVLVFSSKSLSNAFYWTGMIVGAFLFLVVCVLVWILVWKRPANLTLEGKHHYDLARQQHIDYVENPESLTDFTAEDYKKLYKKYHEQYKESD